MAEGVLCSAENPCAAMQVLAERGKTQEERINKIDDVLNKLQNRLPLWATMAFAVSGTLIGFLAEKAWR